MELGPLQKMRGTLLGGRILGLRVEVCAMRWFWQRNRADRSTRSGKDTPSEQVIPEGAIRRKLRYTGRVQAVGFRFTADGWARQRGLTGWVTNLADGDVLLEVQGTPEQVEGFMSDVAHESKRKGAFIRARLVSCDELDPIPEERFSIRNLSF